MEADLDLRGTDGPRFARRTPAAAGDKPVSAATRVAPPGRARRDRWQKGEDETGQDGLKRDRPDAIQPDTRSDSSRDTGAEAETGSQTPDPKAATGNQAPPDQAPTGPAVPTAVYLQAVDPATGSVIWQAPLPSDPVETAALPETGPGGETLSADPRSIGAIARQAYAAQDEENDVPHIVRTA